jgi:FtsP/CotA-like multicopper oxidase with cupredoxin domain
MVQFGTLPYALAFGAKNDSFDWIRYQSHYSAQYSSGVQGALVIHGPVHDDYDEDPRPGILSDWFRDDYWPIIQYVMASSNQTDGYRPYSAGNLVNCEGGTHDAMIYKEQQQTRPAYETHSRLLSVRKHQ